MEGHPITAKYVEQLHPRRKTVHRLKLDPGSFRHTIPPSVTTVIVKQRKDGWEEEFGLEKQAYDRLDELQGIVIPQIYGQGFFHGLPALVLSDVAGSTLFDIARNKTEVEDETVEYELMEALKKLYEHGAEHWDQKLDNFLLCNNGKLMIVDLEEVRFPNKCGPWENSVNLGGVHHLMSDFRYIRDPNRPSSPISFWMTKPDDGGALGTARPNSPAQLMKRGNAEQPNFTASADARKDRTVALRARRASGNRLEAPRYPRSRRGKRARKYGTRVLGRRLKFNLAG